MFVLTGCPQTHEGETEGVQEGNQEGLIEGQLEGDQEGMVEGRIEGIEEGVFEGILEGIQEGLPEGELQEGDYEGTLEGIQEGIHEGLEEGVQEGEYEGTLEGGVEGENEGIQEGTQEGAFEGLDEGIQEGAEEGLSEGEPLEEGEGDQEGILEGLEEGMQEGEQEGIPEGEAITIGSVVELQKIGKEEGYPLDGHYILTGDIDASETETWNEGAGFEPIGNIGAPFIGNFDGRGYAISGLVINRPEEIFIGLFGCIAYGATINRLSLVDASVTGESYVGALAGVNWGEVTESSILSDVDGEGHDIGGLIGWNLGVLDRSNASGTMHGRTEVGGGLAGYNGGTIRNCSTDESISVNGYSVGGLVGLNEGVITRSFSSGSRYCHSYTYNGHIYYISTSIGGFVGENAGEISESYTDGRVAGGSGVGGFAGTNSGSISQCFAACRVSDYTKSIKFLDDNEEQKQEDRCNFSTPSPSRSTRWSGGFLSTNEGIVRQCFSASVFSGGGTYRGFVCFNTEGVGVVEVSYWDLDRSGTTYSQGGEGKSSAELKQKRIYTEAGWDFEQVWEISEGQSYPWMKAFGVPPLACFIATPVLGDAPLTVTFSSQSSRGSESTIAYDWDFGDGTHSTEQNPVYTYSIPGLYTVSLTVSNNKGEDYFTKTNLIHVPIPIASIDELQQIGNDESYPINADYFLANDIDATVTAEWNEGAGFLPLAAGTNAFQGVFDGRGHVIEGLTINRPSEDYIGLFASTYGEIRNLRLESGSIRGQDYVGALAGRSSATITDCSSTCLVSGSRYIGGLLGYHSGRGISRCYTTGNVTGEAWTEVSSYGSDYGCVGGLIGQSQSLEISECYSTGNVSGASEGVGGLIGYSGSDLLQCYALGNVEGTAGCVGGLVGIQHYSTLLQCFAHGEVRGQINVGGLVGSASYGCIDQCYSTGPVTGTEQIGGLVGGYAEINSDGAFWDTEQSGLSVSAIGTGKTTVEMMQQVTFSAAGWDFVSNWGIEEGLSYPWLQALGRPEGADSGEGEGEK